MFKFIVLASMVAIVISQYHDEADGGNGGGNGGYGGHEDYHQPIPYKYGFDIHGGDEHHGDFQQTRQEHGDGHGNVQGSYSYTDSHGNHRQVQYIADKGGFRAQVRTNEPGTESQNPADVEFHSDASRHQYGGSIGYGGSNSYGGSNHESY